MKPIWIILLLPFLAGCSTGLKQQWYDFNAYYNTFYNAKNYFEAGLEADRNERPDINPHQLIRIHPPPSGRGVDEFGIAIEKSAEILRRHSRSNYVDEAIELIGKSNYYRGEYFAALEKFRELRQVTQDPERRSSAVIWEGRTYLELGFYGEGIRFLEELLVGAEPVPLEEEATGLSAMPGWSPVRLAEARAVLAQLYAFQGNHYQAGLQLLFALEDLYETDLAPRVYYHYGQLMEQMENLEQAASAFGAISDMQAPFHLGVHARLKEADILRQRGEFQEANLRLDRMARDDNYSDYSSEILYEMARLGLDLGEIGAAEERFRQILRASPPAPPIVQARTYDQLAQLYQHHYQDAITTAAYYDSAASVQVDPEHLPEEWNVDVLAEAWGELADTRREVTRLDSLLELSQLTPAELEERVLEIEQQLAQQRREQQSPEPVQPDLEPPIAVTTDTERRGFLNDNNPEQLQRDRRRFQEIWGTRELRDNWRRAHAATVLRPLAAEGAVDSLENGMAVAEDPAEMKARLNLDEIPQTREERWEMIRQLYDLHYRMGIIYMIELGMEQEAEEQFLLVRDMGPDGPSKLSSIYALAQISLDRGNRAQAERYAEELRALDAESRQARTLLERLGLASPESGSSSLETDSGR